MGASWAGHCVREHSDWKVVRDGCIGDDRFRI